MSSQAKKALEDSLTEYFNGDSDAFYINSMAELLDMMNQMTNLMITVLTLIAGISLVVGGIGIMNIMLVSVTERTREIGIRKALGAKERYIMSQFVIEAAATSALGGVIGIILGYILCFVVTRVILRYLCGTIYRYTDVLLCNGVVWNISRYRYILRIYAG